MGAAGFSGSFAPIVQYEKWEIHKVFPHFPYFRLGQNLSPNLLAPLCGVALANIKSSVNQLQMDCGVKRNRPPVMVSRIPPPIGKNCPQAVKKSA